MFTHFMLRFSRCGRASYKAGPSESQLLDHGNQILKTGGFESCRQGLLVQSFAFEFGLSHLERQFADFQRTGLGRGEKSERRAEKDPGFRVHRSTTRV